MAENAQTGSRSDDDLVAIARIVRPRGLRGELIAEVLTDFPDRFDGLVNVTAVMPEGDRRDLKIESFWFQKDRVVLKFAGVVRVEDAELLRDAEICVTEAEAVELGDDEFFEWQIEGCRVETADGNSLGEVREVMRTGGTEILVVDGIDREYLIPFAGSICTDVDVDAKVIKIDPPEGLLEF
ncbi:MAG: ribosome maturation factor RimM [Pyrinomonadaceae bacterium]